MYKQAVMNMFFPIPLLYLNGSILMILSCLVIHGYVSYFHSLDIIYSAAVSNLNIHWTAVESESEDKL